jgi:hypothetical protein
MTLTETNHPAEHVISEAPGTRSREAITVASAANLLAGTVLGQVTQGTKTAVGAAGVPAPAAATITAGPTAALNTKVGVHTFVCIVGGAGTASKWRHVDPNGELVGVATGNTAYAGGGLSALTITDAGTDPVVGETFTVTVTAAAASGKYKIIAPAAIDGTQHAAAILYGYAEAASADADAVAHVRDSEHNADILTWSAGITNDEKAAAILELAALGIILR